MKLYQIIKTNNYNKDLNYGIQILRVILSYLVLQLHCLNKKLTKKKILIFLTHFIFMFQHSILFLIIFLINL